MTEALRYDAIVIGGGVNGLTAAAYLARAGKRTLLLEARDAMGGCCETVDMGNGFRAPKIAHALYALDARATSDLRLTRHGLKFVVRDAPMALLGHGAEPLVIARDMRVSARNIAAVSRADAVAWPPYRREMLAFGRALRALWWNAKETFTPDDAIERLSRMGTGAWLDSRFESDALKSLLAFDASALSPLDAGSALLLAWRAAQEMCGLQDATAFPAGGPGMLVKALEASCLAEGVEMRTNAAAGALILKDGRITGIGLRSGEVVMAPLVLSSLARRTTLLVLAGGANVGLAERRKMQNASPSPATVKILLAFEQLPLADKFADILRGRLIVAERWDSYASAHAAARAGRISEEPVMEVVFPSAADPSLAPAGGHIASVLVRPLPNAIQGGWNAWKSALAGTVVGKLNHAIPGLARHVTGAKIFTPDDLAADGHGEYEGVSPSRMLTSWSDRIRTPMEGLFLCGEDAEPVPAISGRAGRIAAMFALQSGAAR